MKHSKVFYTTDMGNTFKTIAPVPPSKAADYMREHYSRITIDSGVASVKKSYKRFCNIFVKARQ